MWQKIVKWVLFPLFFFTVFLVALYWTFPARTLKGYVAHQIEKTLSADHEGSWTQAPEVTIQEMSLWRLSGLGMRNVIIRLGSLDEKPGSRWDFEKLKFRIGLISSFFGNPRIEFSGNLYDGSADGSITMTKTNQIAAFWIEMDKINLKKFAGIENSLGLPLTGTMSVDADFDMGKNASQDGEGTLQFNFSKLELGPGKLNLPMQGFSEGLSVPHIILGSLDGDLELIKGKGKTRQLKLIGGDIEADVNLAVELNKDIMRSKLDGSGWFKVSDTFLAKNPSFKSLLEITPDLKAAREADGKYSFSLKGTLDRPRPKLGTDQRSSSKEQKNPLRSFGS